MNDERRQWRKQFDSNFGAKEFLRFSAAMALWWGLWIAVLVILNFTSNILTTILITVLLLTLFAFAGVATRWRPAYRILRVILGNPNMPNEPLPGRKTPPQPRPWWSLLPSFWWLVMDILLLYLAIRFLVK